MCNIAIWQVEDSSSQNSVSWNTLEAYLDWLYVVTSNSCFCILFIVKVIYFDCTFCMWPNLPKGVSFKTHFSSPFDSHINGPTAHVFKYCWRLNSLLSLRSLSQEIYKCSGGLQMVPSSLDKQTADCDSPYDWLMSLAMNLAALCDMWRWKWH